MIDFRVLCPLDFATVPRSIVKTNRCLIAREDYAEYGVAAEVGARVPRKYARC